MSKTYKVQDGDGRVWTWCKDGDGRVWTIAKQPCGWVAFVSNTLVLDPFYTLRETKAAVRGIKNLQVLGEA